MITVPTAAQPEEEHQADGSDCMGPTDPFCPLNPLWPGGPASNPADCYTCEYIPQGPQGQSSYFFCLRESNPTCCGTYIKNCRWGTYNCYFDGYCVFA